MVRRGHWCGDYEPRASEEDGFCQSRHTVRCTLEAGHDGPHGAFRTRLSWKDEA